jgi:hypothetical protein
MISAPLPYTEKYGRIDSFSEEFEKFSQKARPEDRCLLPTSPSVWRDMRTEAAMR